MTEEGQYLVDFIYAQGGLTLFEFADEAQSDAHEIRVIRCYAI